MKNDATKNREQGQRTLKHWQVDSELVGVRDAAALAKLPDQERPIWEAFWKEVTAALANMPQPPPK